MPKVHPRSIVVLTLSVLLYLVPFTLLTLFHYSSLNGWQQYAKEVVWWSFFIPALLLTYPYGLRGVRVILFFSALLVPIFIALYFEGVLVNRLWMHGVMALLGSLLTGLCFGLLSARFSRSRQAVEEQNKLLKSLFEASELLAISLNPQDVLLKSLEIIRASLHFDYADIWLLEDENTLRNAASNLPVVFGATATLPANYYLPGMALKSGEGVFVQDPLNDDRILDKTWARQLGHASEAALPLIHQGEKLGVLIVASMKTYDFTPDRCELLQTFVNQLALSIKNASLYRVMEQKALVDELTGLYNHRYFQETLEVEIKRAERQSMELSLIMLDLDYFKDYNDTFGHPEGDRLLSEFGRVLKLAVRETDIATRYGGDEFAVIMPNTDAQGATQLKSRIAEKVGEHKFPGYDQMPTGKMLVSIGSATYPKPAVDKLELVKMADEQLYEMKNMRRQLKRYKS